MAFKKNKRNDDKEVKIICISLGIFVLLNAVCFRTVKIQNFLKYKKKIEEIEERDVAMVICGSTYAKYAFSACLDCQNLIFANSHQSLCEDSYLLKKYACKIREGGDILLLIAPFTALLYDKYSYGIQRNFYLLNKREYADCPRKKYIVNKYMPLIAGVVSNLGDMKRKKSDRAIDNIVNVWKELFDIEEFNKENLSSDNIMAIENNTQVIQNMINFCNQSLFRLWIVAVPLTDELNSVFQKDFIDMTIYQIIRNLKGEYSFLDYREHPAFRNINLYRDTCFYLNEEGSKKFEQILFEDMEKIKRENREEK